MSRGEAETDQLRARLESQLDRFSVGLKKAAIADLVRMRPKLLKWSAFHTKGPIFSVGNFTIMNTRTFVALCVMS